MALVHYATMTTVTIHQAKTHLSRIVERVQAGEKIVVVRGREPVMALRAIRAPRAKRRVGGLPHLVVHMADDFDAPLEDFAEYSS